MLAGVNPVHGLYASFVGPAVGGLTSSTRLMVVGTTSAAALAAGSAIADIDLRPNGNSPPAAGRTAPPYAWGDELTPDGVWMANT